MREHLLVEGGAMALREYERRILAEIEQHLSEDDPDLAGRMEMFGADIPALNEDTRSAWRPWAVCVTIATAVIGLLVLLITLTPAAQEGDSETSPAVGSDVVSPDPGAATR